MTLDLSLSEFTALTAKAFRGVGYPWGLASDGAFAARVLAQHNLPADKIVARLLTAVDGHEFASFGNESPPSTNTDMPWCSVFVGVVLADFGPRGATEAASMIGPRRVLEPALLGPWLTDCVVDWGVGYLIVSGDSIDLNDALPTSPSTVAIRPLNADEAARVATTAHMLSTRIQVDDSTYDTLRELASRTYVPATDASRNSGAGEDA